jgi:BMFP domain-containing protein YqiC
MRHIRRQTPPAATIAVLIRDFLAHGVPGPGPDRGKAEGNRPMPQTTGRLFDEIAKLMTDAAGAVQGARGEIDGALRSKAEQFMRELDIVQREEFDALKTMVLKLREENEQLRQRLDELEKRAGPGEKDIPG